MSFENHNRFVAGTTLFQDFLKHLGFELKNTDTKHPASKSKPILTFGLHNKVVIDAYDWVELLTELPDKTPHREYRGYTVSKDLLTFFSQRQIEEVKK